MLHSLALTFLLRYPGLFQTDRCEPSLFQTDAIMNIRPVRTLPAGYPGGRGGANPASGPGSAVIITQGQFS